MNQWYPLKRRLHGRRNQSGQLVRENPLPLAGIKPQFLGSSVRDLDTTDHGIGGHCYNGLVVELTGCNSSVFQGIIYMFRLKYTHRQADFENKKEEFTAQWM